VVMKGAIRQREAGSTTAYHVAGGKERKSQEKQ
jgi:hypothetical protein